jgi:hypothetical protein
MEEDAEREPTCVLMNAALGLVAGFASDTGRHGSAFRSIFVVVDSVVPVVTFRAA